MPELPEAETIVRTIAPRLLGRRIIAVRCFSARVHGGSLPRLAGRRIRQVRRYGKRVVLELDKGFLVIRLGMTGALLLDERRGPYTRALLRLDQGALRFDDPRQFGSICWQPAPPGELGPDPLEITPEEFCWLLATRRRQIKALLLDQSFVRGVGNIYADEALFRAGIHPRAICGPRARGRRLHLAIVEVFTQAIRSGGSSVNNYVNGEGRPGYFQFRHLVYQKDGQPCARCGAIIRRILVAQRGTHFCPRCQKP